MSWLMGASLAQAGSSGQDMVVKVAAQMVLELSDEERQFLMEFREHLRGLHQSSTFDLRNEIKCLQDGEWRSWGSDCHKWAEKMPEILSQYSKMRVALSLARPQFRAESAQLMMKDARTQFHSHPQHFFDRWAVDLFGDLPGIPKMDPLSLLETAAAQAAFQKYVDDLVLEQETRWTDQRGANTTPQAPSLWVNGKEVKELKGRILFYAKNAAFARKDLFQKQMFEAYLSVFNENPYFFWFRPEKGASELDDSLYLSLAEALASSLKMQEKLFSNLFDGTSDADLFLLLAFTPQVETFAQIVGPNYAEDRAIGLMSDLLARYKKYEMFGDLSLVGAVVGVSIGSGRLVSKTPVGRVAIGLLTGIGANSTFLTITSGRYHQAFKQVAASVEYRDLLRTVTDLYGLGDSMAWEVLLYGAGSGVTDLVSLAKNRWSQFKKLGPGVSMNSELKSKNKIKFNEEPVNQHLNEGDVDSRLAPMSQGEWNHATQ
ncbi:MAG: hypothetical protein KDD59_05085 [Bdellovibrionales bacterium]|nr:hypothetical protein [Bdellovibrionales bacterium]